MALAAAGLGVAGLESLSFGHEHLAGGEALHHHHVYLGSHGHAGGHGHGHGHGHEHVREDEHGHSHGHGEEHGQEDGQEHGPGTATVSAVPALFQPLPVRLPLIVPAESALLAPLPAPTSPQRIALPPSPPRGPPLSLVLSSL